MSSYLILASPFIFTIAMWGLTFLLFSGFWFYVACVGCAVLTIACVLLVLIFKDFRVQ